MQGKRGYRSCEKKEGDRTTQSTQQSGDFAYIKRNQSRGERKLGRTALENEGGDRGREGRNWKEMCKKAFTLTRVLLSREGGGGTPKRFTDVGGRGRGGKEDRIFASGRWEKGRYVRTIPLSFF